MDFEPINSDHAVQSAGFALIFNGPIPQTAVRSLAQNRDLLEELPAVQNPEGIELALAAPTAANLPVPRRTRGVQLAHLRPDGTPAWALRMIGQEIAVECTRYTRWAKVWGTARHYVMAGLRTVQEHDANRKIVLLGHAVIDQFAANREDYSLDSVLKGNQYLAGRTFRSAPTWHNHVGWFEQANVDSRSWLNQLNLDAYREPHPPRRLVLQITHNQEMRFVQPLEISQVVEVIDETMNILHAQNKRVLAELLTDEMAAKVGLGPNGQ